MRSTPDGHEAFVDGQGDEGVGVDDQSGEVALREQIKLKSTSQNFIHLSLTESPNKIDRYPLASLSSMF
jgi:hypothetical protein